MTLRRHQRKIHGHKIRIKKEKIYKCDFCDKTFASITGLRDHQQKVHGFYIKPVKIKQLYDVDYEKIQNHKCNMCTNVFFSDKSLKSHKAKIHGLNKKVVLKSPTNENDMLIEEDSICPPKKKYKKSPMLIEDSLAPIQNRKCLSCSKSFPTITNLRRHVNTVHLQHKDFKCEYCERAFSQLGNLRQHIQNIHTGKKNYECDQCHRTFVVPSKLKRHQEKCWSGQ